MVIAPSTALNRAASVIVALVGGLVLVGWLLDIASLKSVFPGLVTMKANTALAFFLAGVSLWWRQNANADQRGRRIAQAGAFVVALLGLATLGESLLGRDLGIDQLLFRESVEAVGTSSPGRMAPTTALNFLVLGLGLSMLGVETRRGHRPAEFLVLPALLISWLALIGYLYDVKPLYGVASYTQMAVHTALAFIVLCAGMLFARPGRGLMAIVTVASSGGAMARRLIPAAVVVPTALGLLRLEGQRAGLYSTEFGLSLLVVLSTVILTAIIWQHARSLDGNETERQRAEEALKGLAVENERLYTEASRRAREAEVLAGVAGTIAASLDVDTVLRGVAEAAAGLCGSDLAWLALREPATGAMVFRHWPGARGHGYGDLRIEPGKGIGGHVLVTGRPFRTDNYMEDPRITKDYAVVALVEGVIAAMVVPIRRKDRVEGLLYVENRSARPFTDRDEAILLRAANHAAVAIENARLYEDIKNSRDFLRSVTDASEDAIVTTDIHGRLTYLSPSALAIFGYRLEELLGRPAGDYYRGGSEEARAIMRRLTTGERIRNYETAFRASDGRWVEANASVSLLYNASGAIDGTLAVIRDMTESRRAEDVLSKLSSAVEHAGDAVFVTDREGVIDYVNPAFERLTGYTREDVVGQTARMLKSGRHPPRFYEDLWQRILAGDTVRRVFLNRRKDGTLYYEEKTIAPIRDRGGGISHFVSTGRDITERRNAEERQAVRFAVARALAQCPTLAEATPHLLKALGEGLRWEVAELWRWDSRTDLLRREGGWYAPSLAAQEVERLSGRMILQPGQGLAGRVYISRAVTWMPEIADDPEGGEDAVAAAAGLHAAFAFPVPSDAGMAAVLLVFGRERRPRDDAWLEMGAEIGSQIGQFVARELAQKALVEREEQLRQSQKMEAVGTLAGGIAHDFNNLMTVIAGRADLLMLRAGQDQRLSRDLDIIRKTAARATALVRQLLTFSRRQVLEPRVLDLNGVVEGTRPMLERLIREDIELATVLGPDLGRIRVDPGQIEQVIVNLVVNARDAMPQGGRLTLETASVELDQAGESRRASVEPGSYVRLSVRDTGCGMDAETQSRIFEPFFTTKAPGQGTGLGLSTVYGIVRQSGGGICVESQPDRGTTFRIYLPRVDEPLDATAPAGPPGETRGGTETVLLVEDEEDLRALAREILQSHGYTVLEANDVTDAMAIGARHPATIDLLVTDVIMPTMSGPDLVQQLLSARPGMKVLYMSGYVDNLVQSGLREGDTLLGKPFTPDTLARTVREILDR